MYHIVDELYKSSVNPKGPHVTCMKEWTCIDFIPMLNDFNKVNNINTSYSTEIKDILPTAIGVLVVHNDAKIYFLELLDNITITKCFDYTLIGLITIGYGLMSTKLLFCRKDGKIDAYSADRLNSSKAGIALIDYEGEMSEPKFVTCLHQSTEVVVTKDNRLFISSDNEHTMGVGGDPRENWKGINIFTHYPSARFDSEIVDLKGGYGHIVVLLANGKVYAQGFNSLHQCGHSNGNTLDVMQLPEGLKDTFVKEIWCSSRGTVLRTKTELVFFGECADRCTAKLSYNGISHVTFLPIEEHVKVQVANKPWGYIISGKYATQKSLEYFQHKLQQLLTRRHVLSDISICCSD